LSPSSLRYNKKGDGNFTDVAFFTALQRNKKKEVTATMLPLPSLLHCNKKEEGSGAKKATTTTLLLLSLLRCKEKKGDGNIVVIVFFTPLQLKKKVA